MKTVTLKIRVTSAHRRATVAAHEAPTHPAPLFYLEKGFCALVDQTEHTERTHKRDGDLFNVLTFNVTVTAPALMSKRDVAEHVRRKLSIVFPHCAASVFWESNDVEVTPVRV